uniref:Uncharacterized protein n=1 Tax=Arundo donax TaxID=35708 RepID=A0A0A9FA89_ARUDO
MCRACRELCLFRLPIISKELRSGFNMAR